MKPPLKLGIAGLGTVGVGLLELLEKNGALIAERAGRRVEVKAVCARNRKKARGVALEGYAWEDDPCALAGREDIDVYVELIGGAEGAAKDSIETALARGCDVVSANKALLAHHGYALGKQAEKTGAALAYEAAVAGAIPVIKTLSEALAANRITRVLGVMNGTCNYILTRMEKANISYEDSFAEATALGYLEEDPDLDVKGIDTAHKLAILSALSFGAKVDFANVTHEGITEITYDDITYALKLGFRIKLLGVSHKSGTKIEQRVSPCLVPQNSPFGLLDNSANMIAIDCDGAGQILLQGAGAGSLPTASAVLGDIIDIARGQRRPPFGVPVEMLTAYAKQEDSATNAYYLRVFLKNHPGALSEVTGILGKHNVSIDRLRQPICESDMACVVIITHDVTHKTIRAAQAELSSLETILGKTIAIRIEKV